MWNLSPPPEFQGLRDDSPLTVYFRHLPHWRQDGATSFVTFRLIDALPKAKLHELRRLRAEWAEHRELPASFRDAVEWSTLKFKNHDNLEELYQEAMTRIDKRLDEGAASCLLKDRQAAAVLAESLHHFDGKRYVLGCYRILPNHCHAILTPTPDRNKHGANDIDGACFPLERVLQSWKRRSAFEINGRFNRSGSLWQEESYDRIIRDGEHLYSSIQYIGRNPKAAHLTTDECLLWIRPEWLSLGWSFCWLLRQRLVERLIGSIARNGRITHPWGSRLATATLDADGPIRPTDPPGLVRFRAFSSQMIVVRPVRQSPPSRRLVTPNVGGS